jgi:hypothetical protein
MKLNKEITSGSWMWGKTGESWMWGKIYDVDKAHELYDKGIGYRELSLMKQENIRVGILDERVSLDELKSVFGRHCGYCFKFWGEVSCIFCPIFKKVNKQCFELKPFKRALSAKTKEEFSKCHKEWCKLIGLWQEEWE